MKTQAAGPVETMLLVHYITQHHIPQNRKLPSSCLPETLTLSCWTSELC